MHSLVYHRLEMNWNGAEIPPHAVETVKFDLKFFNDQEFSSGQIQQRISFMEKRYKTFRSIANNREFRYMYGDPVVTGNDMSWEKLFEKNSFAKAYYHKVEPQWDKLLELFGFDAVKKEGDDTVILISDSPKPFAKPHDESHKICEEDEVTSPVLNATRRKLFSDVYTSDEHSTSQRSFPQQNAFPPRVQQRSSKVANGKKNASSSSCASSSPKFWNNNPFV